MNFDKSMSPETSNYHQNLRARKLTKRKNAKAKNYKEVLIQSLTKFKLESNFDKSSAKNEPAEQNAENKKLRGRSITVFGIKLNRNQVKKEDQITEGVEIPEEEGGMWPNEYIDKEESIPLHTPKLTYVVESKKFG